MQPTDPIQPFRDEYERYFTNGKTTLSGMIGGHAFTDPDNDAEEIILGVEYSEWEFADEQGNHAVSLMFVPDQRTLQAYRAARALQIAETEGMDAALLWKLSN